MLREVIGLCAAPVSVRSSDNILWQHFMMLLVACTKSGDIEDRSLVCSVHYGHCFLCYARPVAEITRWMQSCNYSK